MKDGVPLGEDGLKDIVSFAQASSHLEVVKCEPRLGPMWERLRQRPHAYAGPEREAEEEEAPDGDAPGADADGGDRTRARGIEEEDLVENTQASRAEIVDAPPPVRRFATRPTATGGEASTRRTRITSWTCSGHREGAGDVAGHRGRGGGDGDGGG